MLSNGRPEDQHFDLAEMLYRRYLNVHWEGNRIVDAHFSFPPSVNREKYSRPEDTLFSDVGRFNGWGVLEFATKHVPTRLEDAAGTGFAFFPRHVPEDENYSHSEIWCEREQQRGETADPSPTAKKKFRAMLSQQVRVRIQALV
jgi:hypothetical protein